MTFTKVQLGKTSSHVDGCGARNAGVDYVAFLSSQPDPYEDLLDAIMPEIAKNWNRLSRPEERLHEGWATIEMALTATASAFFIPYLKVLGEAAAKATIERLARGNADKKDREKVREIIFRSSRSDRDRARAMASEAVSSRLAKTDIPEAAQRRIVLVLDETMRISEETIDHEGQHEP